MGGGMGEGGGWNVILACFKPSHADRKHTGKFRNTRKHKPAPHVVTISLAVQDLTADVYEDLGFLYCTKLIAQHYTETFSDFPSSRK